MKPPTNKWLLALLIGAVVVLIASAILRALTPETTIPQTGFISTNYNQTTTQFGRFEYVGEDIVVPNSLPLATPVGLISEEQLITQLRTNLNLQQTNEAFSLLQGREYTLSLGDTFAPHTLTQNQATAVRNATDSANVTQPLPPLNLALDVSSSFIAQALPNTPLVPLENRVEYLGGSVHLAPTNSEEATVIAIPFASSVEGFPVMLEKTTSFPAQVFINRNSQVSKVTIQPQLQDFEADEAILPIISVPEAMRNIEANRASVISSIGEDFASIDLSSLSSGVLTTASIEYRYDDVLGLAYPFYRFSGTALDPTGKTVNLELITPAVATSAQ